jgi:hypothetical protein
MGMRTGTISSLLLLTVACDGPAQTTAPEQQPRPAVQPVAAAPPPAAVVSVADVAGDPSVCGTPSPYRTPPPPAKAKNYCPHPFVFTASQQPQHMWLSSEGTYKFEERSYSPRFFLSLDVTKGQPHLVIENAAYKYSTPIVPDHPRTFRLNNWQISLDTVLPGRETHYENNAWHSHGQVRVHAAVRVESVLPPFDSPVPAASTCGEPSVARTTLPPGLSQHPAPANTVNLNFGQTRKFGDVEVEYVTRMHQFNGVPPEPRPMLGLHDLTAPYPNVVELHTDRSGGFIRADRELLLASVKTAKDPAVIRRFPLACPSALAVPAPSAPTWLWLGTFGHTRALIGDPTAPTVTLELKYGQLWATSANGSYSRFLAPESEQNAFSLDGYVIEVVDVEPTGTDRYVDGHWISDQMLSGVNVQLRVTPAA